MWLGNSQRALLAGLSPSGSSRLLPEFYKWDDQKQYKGQMNKKVFLLENVFTALRLENDPGKI